MKIQQKTISDTEVQLTVDVEASDLKIAREAEVKKQAKLVKVPGFRTGKVPLEVAEKQLDTDNLNATVLEAVVDATARKAVDQNKLRVIGQPSVQVEKYVPNEQLQYTLKVEIVPEVKLANYRSIKKSVPKAVVQKSDVDDVLSSLQKRAAEKVAVKRVAKLGDEVVIDFSGEDDKGHPIAGGKGSNYPLLLGSKTFIPGFEEGLIGKKAGDKTVVHPTFPKDYSVKALAGVKAKFDVTVKKVQELKMPELDSKFAAKIGPFKSIDELKSDIKKELQAQKELEATNKLKDEIVEEIVEKSKLTLPTTLVEEQINSLEQDTKQNLLARGITIAEYIKQEGYSDEAEWRDKKLRPDAERRVKIGLTLSAVSEAESIEVTDEELVARVNVMKQQYANSGAAEQLDSPAVQNEILSRIYTEKTVDKLFDMATSKAK